MKNKMFGIVKRGNEKGYSLLEYCVGAAALLGLVYAGMNALGTNLEGFLVQMGDWIKHKGDSTFTDDGGAGGNGGNGA